jgi:hypothetical protein
MTVTFSLSLEAEALLRQRATATGKDFATLVREAVEEKLSGANGNNAADVMPYDRWSAEFTAWMSDISASG